MRLLSSLALLSSFAAGFSISPSPPTLVASSPSFATSTRPTRTNTNTGVIGRKNMAPPSSAVRTSAGRSTSSPSRALSASGGAQEGDSVGSDSGGDSSIEMTTGKLLASFWGTGGFVYILLRSIRKIVPIAMEPFGGAEGVVPLSKVQLGAYILTCLWFAYVEGYKGFQLKFSPLVVSRSLTLHPRSPPHHLLLAPLYSMGLFHATRKRVIVSWSVSLGVAALVAGVKRMPYPWRNIVDAGVVVGLSWGMVSILVGYVLACAKGNSPADPCLPDGAKKGD